MDEKKPNLHTNGESASNNWDHSIKVSMQIIKMLNERELGGEKWC